MDWPDLDPVRRPAGVESYRAGMTSFGRALPCCGAPVASDLITLDATTRE